ncbi:MAG: toll/interleukin-1 receptor domain-containing protein, partial [Lachnospiraceae bacterium]|nr:toll/interleukin-1 receptor domain-containing protein [Lachnospiraceae bacterium]
MENENENVPVEEKETAGETEAQATMGETAAAQETKPVKNELDVFISYSTKNKNVADAVVANFEQHGIRCWYAPRDILPGQEWVSAIKEALHKAKVFVLIYTDESNASRQVMNEVALAFNANKTIVPFRLTEGNMNDELEYYLTRVHWLDAVSKPLERNIEALRNYVETSLNRPASADPTKVAAAAPAATAPKKEG